MDYFHQFGAVSAVIMMDKATQRSRGFGFVTFSSAQEVDAVLGGSHCTKQHVVDGRNVECKACAEDRQQYETAVSSHQPDSDPNRLFVGGLPQSCDADILGQFGAQFGDVCTAKVHMDPATKRSKGFGYIIFTSPRAVDAAVMNGRNNMIHDKWVDVKRATIKEAQAMGGKGGFVVQPPYQQAYQQAYQQDPRAGLVNAIGTLTP